LPDIERRFAQKYGDELRVIAIDANGDAPEGVKSFIANLRITFPIGLEDPATKTYAALNRQFRGANPFPVDVVVDQDGTIAYIAREYDPNAIAAVIEELLGQ
jgi:hypothetical protein